ncbi:MAG: hypothetical protein QOG22_2822, partial [Pseudonocardiales bacterium]|nr:hypothetical protein [Pseudonocardiales bacterium]
VPGSYTGQYLRHMLDERPVRKPAKRARTKTKATAAAR